MYAKVDDWTVSQLLNFSWFSVLNSMLLNLFQGSVSEITQSMDDDPLLDAPLLPPHALHSRMCPRFHAIPTVGIANILLLMHVSCRWVIWINSMMQRCSLPPGLELSERVAELASSSGISCAATRVALSPADKCDVALLLGHLKGGRVSPVSFLWALSRSVLLWSRVLSVPAL